MLTTTPLCFRNDKQYNEWKVLAVKSHLKSTFICVDCTPKYQAEMIKAERCQAPDVDVKMLNLQEIQDSLHQEIIEAKLESFSDHWTQMVNQLTPVIVAPRSKRGRKKK
jgi:hypothetical protein